MKRNQDIKPLIIKTTKALIKKNPHITIKDIADACFVNIAAVNYYFGSKENLISLVLEETIDELILMIKEAIAALPEGAPLEITLEQMINIVYNFAFENHGIITHMFLKSETQTSATNLLLETFFAKSEFTESVLQKIAEETHIVDQEILYARYVLLFSSFAIPLLIQLLQEPLEDKPEVLNLKNPRFKKAYIKELLRIIH